eukprot:scaffold2809_cov119-Skeletonema_menzelii.AAC.11
MGGRWEPDGSSHGRVLAGTVDGSTGPPMGGAPPMGAFLVVDNLAPYWAPARGAKVLSAPGARR